jgi:acetolactate synthase-1/2/3 large subunit
MTGAQHLIAALESHGVEAIFGHPGGAIMPVYDALVGARVRHVLMRHEQGAALAADGYARATGKVGVCLATSGPGATNLITGIANAYMDSVPLLAITGQVPLPLIGTDAFQEVDILGMTLGIVKHSFLVATPEDLLWVVDEAFRLARSGRPGPVLIDLPKDIAAANCSFPDLPEGERRAAALAELGPAPRIGADAGDIATAVGLLQASERPLVYAGGGIGLGNLVEDFRGFVATAGIPVVTTLRGLGAVPTDHPLFLGMLGMHGSAAANLAVQACDLLVCIGARFDDRATGKLDEFAPEARVVHLDVDRSEVGKLRRADAAVVAEDLRPALAALSMPLAIDPWRRECCERKAAGAYRYDAPGDLVYAPELLRQLSESIGDEAIVVCDVGQHQMWVAQHCRFSRPEKHLSSGGLGTMGFGLPAAIGAKLGRPADRVVLVTGDGSIMMNLQEFATLVRYGIDVKIVLLDNNSLGLVRQWQELFFDGRFSEVDLWDNPDFGRLANAFGIPSIHIGRRREVGPGINWLLAVDGPAFAHVAIDARHNVWPLVPPGCSNATMMTGNAPRPADRKCTGTS